eukprot:TRINITY_DN2696_c5_g1_i1.p1 TRINITY_DN2696_c5_g1~~TRINITY_DN2696_c5_g1_i1.p1  ORF type:complete len:551 (+),score=83.81 TRINITY_DN2696_c5_g1_i1:34-1653(+)
MFSILVAAEMGHANQNFQINFPAHPTIDELRRQTDAIFRQEANKVQLVFNIGRFQLYKEGVWVDLTSPGQIHEGCQLFVLPEEPRMASTNTPSSVLYSKLKGNVGLEEKIDALFNEFDVNNDRTIDAGEMHRGMEALRVEFNHATIADLFKKGDKNKSGVIERTEWEAFCQRYPTLLDSLFLRLKSARDTVLRDNDLRDAHQLLNDLKRQAAAAEQDWDAARRACDEAHQRFSEVEQSLANAAEASINLQKYRQEASREVADSENTIAEARRHIGVCKDREHQCQNLLLDMQHEISAQTARVHACAQQTLAADERERAVTQRYQETLAIGEDVKNVLKNLDVALRDARHREQQGAAAVGDANRDTNISFETFERSDADVNTVKQAEARASEAHRAAFTTITRITSQQEIDQRTFAELQGAQAAAHDHLVSIRCNIEATMLRLESLEAENAAFNQRRCQIEHQETPLIEQEIRLRSQRNYLEVEEEKLRVGCNSFQTAATEVIHQHVHVIPDDSLTAAAERYTNTVSRHRVRSASRSRIL